MSFAQSSGRWGSCYLYFWKTHTFTVFVFSFCLFLCFLSGFLFRDVPLSVNVWVCVVPLSLSLSSIGHGCVFHAPVSSIMTLRDVAPSTNNSHLIQNSLSFTVYIRARCIFSLSLSRSRSHSHDLLKVTTFSTRLSIVRLGY